MFAQPVYSSVEEKSRKKWPESAFVVKEYPIRIPFLCTFNVNLFRVVWRTLYVMSITTLSIIFPFFNDILGLFGALVFWPLAVYFPIEMHIEQTKIASYSRKWLGLKILSGACLIVSLLAAAGSIRGIITELKTFKPFMSVS